jgi:hypothetical protein
MTSKKTKRKAGDGVVKTTTGAASVSPDEIDDVRLISAREFRRMLGDISAMQMHRWVHEPNLGFPKPIKLGVPTTKKARIISTRSFFRFREAVAWIAKRETLSAIRNKAAA